MRIIISILAVLCLAFFVLFFILKDFDMIKSWHKKLFGILLVGLVILIGTYTFVQDNQAKLDSELQIRFLRGETLICNGIEVNSERFNFVTGTLSFIGKKDSEAKDIMVSLDRCK